MITIQMTVAEENITLPMEVGAEYAVAPTVQYKGEYEFTPSAQTQTIEIYGKTATENIIINPIPNNYGLVSWNGSTLTVQ